MQGDKSASIEVVTPKQAEAWIEHNYTHNRPVSKSHVAFLANEMGIGRFTSALIHFVYEGNNVHLVNGQHTLMACIKSGVPFEAVVKRERIEKDDMGALAGMYMHHDIHRKRSFMDTARAFQLGEKMGLPDSWINYTASAIKHGRSGFGLSLGNGDRSRGHYTGVSDLFDLVQAWRSESKALYDIWGQSKRARPFVKRSFFSVALVTMYYQPKKAVEFWSQAAADDGLGIGDPRKTLYEYAHRSISPRGFMGEAIPADVLSIAASYCWNAFVEDRSISKIVVRESARGKPISLTGTSYSGSQDDFFWPMKNLNGERWIKPS